MEDGQKGVGGGRSPHMTPPTLPYLSTRAGVVMELFEKRVSDVLSQLAFFVSEGDNYTSLY